LIRQLAGVSFEQTHGRRVSGRVMEHGIHGACGEDSGEDGADGALDHGLLVDGWNQDGHSRA
jgi:hypothetical protein